MQNGAVVLSLVSAGRPDLGDTVGARPPRVLPLAGAVTLSEALQRTGGLPEYIRSPGFIESLIRDPAVYLSPRDPLGFIRNEPRTAIRPPPRSTPASTWPPSSAPRSSRW
jgi:D-alanyl-D-alanine carboxypeptidase